MCNREYVSSSGGVARLNRSCTSEIFPEGLPELVRPDHVNDWVESAVDNNHYNNGRAECVGDLTGTEFGHNQNTDEC